MAFGCCSTNAMKSAFCGGETVLIVMLCVCIAAANANSQNEVQVKTNATTNISITTKTTIPPRQCGGTQTMVDECFKDLPPHLMEFLQSTKIVINEEEIASKCNVFDRGMKCFDDYTARCLSKQKRNLFKNNVEGARNFFLKFCGDREFQKDYLRHKDCFSYIQKDWMRCTNSFQNILSDRQHLERVNDTSKFMEFCCARQAYENCIYSAARYKCYKKSAQFAHETAKMLSDEKHFSNCRQYEQAFCGQNVGSPWTRSPETFLMLLVCLLKCTKFFFL